MSGFVGIKLELGQSIQSSYDTVGFLKAQHNGLGQNPNVGSSEVLHPLGFASRGRDPDVGPDGKALDGGGCKLLIYRDGTEIVVEFKADQRALAGIPPLLKGSSVQYAHTSGRPSFDMHSGDDGTKTIYVEVGDAAHVVTIGNDGNGDPIVEIVHARGMALTFLKDGAVLKNRTGSCYVELKDDGGVLNGNWKVTGAFDIGAASFPLAKSAELLAWALNVNAALNGLGVPVAPMSPSVATALTKGS